ncbi:MAG: GNAT family N-acetyltransferase [Muribaculaceae bacterium]|nr:GNAT family N-acetyltransferase [Muribaculaceae bacterium]
MKQSDNFLVSDSSRRVILRAPEPDDTDILFLWENDVSGWHTSLATGPLSRHQIAEYIDSYDADIYSSGSLRFIIESDGQPVGTLDIFDFDSRARHAFVGIYVAPDWRRRGIGSLALATVASTMTEYVGMTSLVALVAIDNGPSRMMFEKAGFVTTGRLARWIRRGATLVDAVVYQLRLTPSDGR